MGRSRTRLQHGRLAWLREALAAMLWPVPTLIIAAVVAAGVLLPDLDRSVDRHIPHGVRLLLFGGGASEARQLLTAIATGLITTVSLVFSLTVVVFQLASSQYSPRLLRVFPRDWLIRATLGVLVGSFVYAITVLRTVQSGEVPRISVTVGFILTVSGAVLLVVFLGHVVTELRVETMLRHVHREQQRVHNQVLGEPDGEDDDNDEDGADAGEWPEPAGDDDDATVQAAESGYIAAVDEADLLEAATANGIAIRLLRPVGAAVTVGTPLAAYWRVAGGQGDSGQGDSGPPEHDAVCHGIRRGIVVNFERTGAQDLGYGIQQLVDVYIKALSPAINDPTTAVTSLGHLGSVLAQLSRRQLRSRVLRDDQGRVRVVVPISSFSDFLEQALGPVRTYGSDDPRVLARALEVLRDVGWVAPAGPCRDAVRDQIDRLVGVAEHSLTQPVDRERVSAAAARARAACDGRWE